MSGGDGKLAFAWFTGGTSSATVGSVDGYLVQYRSWTEATETEEGSWGSWTTVTKATTDREHTVTGLANGRYQVRVRARSDGDDGDNTTTDRQRYGLFYYTEVELSSDKGATPPLVLYRDVVPRSQSLLVRWRAARAESNTHLYTIRHRTVGTSAWTELKRPAHTTDPACHHGDCSSPLRATISGLTAGVSYEVEIKAHNANGASRWVSVGTARPTS